MTNSNEEDLAIQELIDDRPPNKRILFFVISAAVFSSILFTAKWGFGFFDDMDSWGQIGDFFGGILNPIIGFAGIVLLAHTLRQNQKALALTARELKSSNAQLAISAQALKSQEELMRHESKTITLTQLLMSFSEETKRLRRNQSSSRVNAQKITKALHTKNYDEIPTLLKLFGASSNTNLRYFSTIEFIIRDIENDARRHFYQLIVCYISYEIVAAMYLSTHNSSLTIGVSKSIKDLCEDTLIACELTPLLDMLEDYVERKSN